jgi:carboxypeptidase C (cathepsin A)
MVILRNRVLAALARTLAVFTLAATATVAGAQEHHGSAASHPQQQQNQRQQGDGVLALLPEDSVTRHTIDTPDGKLDYTATAGTLALYDQSGKRSAKIFYTAYVKDGAGSAAQRPLTFAFNGGPGAASAYLNLGLVGPRIVAFGANGHDAAAARLVDNPDTWLAFTDLVLIDPVGTGWSRAAKADDAKGFWNVQTDAEAMAKAIALYLAKSGRSASPKYLLGESYGGFRAAKVARTLQRQQGVAVSGIVMLSPLLEGALTFGGTQFALGAALQLPSLAAAELEHKGQFSKEKLAQAEHFALTDYLSTLAGPPPKGEAAKAFYARVAEISGLPVEVVARTRGFIHAAYVKHLRADKGKIVSRYDATFAIDDPFPTRASARGPDPVLDGVTRAFGGAFSAYARDELGFKTPITYVLLAPDIAGKWDWGKHGGRAGASVSDDLRIEFAIEPSFRLLVAHGYSDMVTPYAATRYVLDHLYAPDDPTRMQLKLYRGGHMFYLDAKARHAFTADAKAFYRAP